MKYLVLITLLFLIIPTLATADCAPGDLNNDGIISNNDTDILAAYFQGIYLVDNETIQACGDYNQNGSVDVGDLQCLELLLKDDLSDDDLLNCPPIKDLTQYCEYVYEGNNFWSFEKTDDIWTEEMAPDPKDITAAYWFEGELVVLNTTDYMLYDPSAPAGTKWKGAIKLSFLWPDIINTLFNPYDIKAAFTINGAPHILDSTFYYRYDGNNNWTMGALQDAGSAKLAPKNYKDITAAWWFNDQLVVQDSKSYYIFDPSNSTGEKWVNSGLLSEACAKHLNAPLDYESVKAGFEYDGQPHIIAKCSHGYMIMGCIDTDGGVVPEEKGYSSGNLSDGTYIEDAEDYCYIGSLDNQVSDCSGKGCMIADWQCTNDPNEAEHTLFVNTSVPCPQGCVDGACMDLNCVDSDGGIVPEEKGYSSGTMLNGEYNGDAEDYCFIGVEGNAVFECMGEGCMLTDYRCGLESGLDGERTIHADTLFVDYSTECPYGCKDGACLDCTPSEEICDGIDNDCDGEVDMANGQKLIRIEIGTLEPIEIGLGYPVPKTWQYCMNGTWVWGGACKPYEDCSTKDIDTDCDGRLPYEDDECVRYVWTKPAGHSYYDTDCNAYRCSCKANAWCDFNNYLDPSKYEVAGLEELASGEWRCYVQKTYYPAVVDYFVSLGLTLDQVGGVWIVNKKINDIPGVFRDWARDLIGWAYKKYVKEGGNPSFDKIESKASQLPKPTYAYSYGIAPKWCYAWDADYCLKRDWVCYHDTYVPDDLLDYHEWGPEEINWLSDIKDQNCGDCWAHSASGTVEAYLNIRDTFANSGRTIEMANANYQLQSSEKLVRDNDLSEQELISSCFDAGDCGGGHADAAIMYIEENGILVENCFSYQGKDSTCAPTCNTRETINGFSIVDTDHGSDEEVRSAIKESLRRYGPMSVCMDWGPFMDWSGGIGKCHGESDSQGHCVVLVGYNDKEEYWIIKNSHGLRWGAGINGYGKIGYGECDMEEFYGDPLYLVN